MNLAAAFGPVTGLAGTIRFTDLLGLVSAPDQVATVTSINPGIAVTDGRIVYRLLPDLKVQVQTARWPFAGGTLTLDPTTLDFGSDAARRMTFRVDGMDAGKFLQQFDFSNLNATGTFDGVLPMIFDEQGGRIADGRLTAREGGGSIAYLGELTEKDLGVWGNLAFQSLRSLTYRSLDVQMNGPLAGEMVTGVSFTGIKQGTGAKSNFLLRRLTRLPIRFNITIRAPFRGLIDSAASFYDPQRLVKRNLQALIDEQNRKTGVQPPASENVP
nr:YdbH domain-containing protein [Sphingomonas endophytica]